MKSWFHTNSNIVSSCERCLFNNVTYGSGKLYMACSEFSIQGCATDLFNLSHFVLIDLAVLP